MIFKLTGNISGSTTGSCTQSGFGSQFTRYCGYYLGLNIVGSGNIPICGKP